MTNTTTNRLNELAELILDGYDLQGIQAVGFSKYEIKNLGQDIKCRLGLNTRCRLFSDTLRSALRHAMQLNPKTKVYELRDLINV